MRRNLRARSRAPWAASLAAAALLLLGPAGAGAATLLSARGEVRAERAGASRAVDARDVLADDERLVTGPGGAAALAVGDLHVQVGADTRLSRAPDGALELARGTIRVVDLGDGAREARVRTPHAVVRAAGADTEVEAGASATEVRQGDGSARVARRDATGRRRENRR